MRGFFTILVSGPHNLTLNRINKKHSSCVIGDQCSLFTKGIGLTLNDILRNKIQWNISFGKQSVLIQTAAGLTMIMFVIGFINGIFSLITFRNKELRKVGCGIYLLASSITSLLTITMFTIKFWFVILIQLYSTVRSSILRTDCVFIGPVLKLCLYLDGWLNACVAMERTVNVSKGVNFNQKKSRHAARWVIFVLPIFIMSTLIHEPIHHELFEYINPKYNPISNSNNLTMNMTMINEYNVLCVIRYSRSVQTYNTITLFIHLVVPFLVNLFSALFIIFGTARRRSIAQTNCLSFASFNHVISIRMCRSIGKSLVISLWLFHFFYTTNACLCCICSTFGTLQKNIQRFNNTVATTNSSIIFDYDQLDVFRIHELTYLICRVSLLSACCINLLLRFASFLI